MKTRGSLLAIFFILQASAVECFQKIITEQEASTLRPGRLIVQVLTEPENLIRIFDGLDLSFQMLRHIGRTGPALMRLSFDKEFLFSPYDQIGLDHWKRPYYARMPTMFSKEAPRYIRVPANGKWLTQSNIVVPAYN